MSNIVTVEKKSESKSNLQYSPTIRIHADLFEPTESRYPVFNYQKLLVEEKRRRRRDQQSNLFDDNDESIKQLADHYEHKYGSTNVKKKKKKKTAFYNYSELAAGYDENDSFIDNTEIFDEVMPEEVETAHGGYYVNTGSLEFKKVYISEDSEDLKSSHRRKNIINTVLEDSDEKLPSFAASNNSDKDSPLETKTSETSKGSSVSSEDEKEPIKPANLVQQSTVSINGKTKRRQSIDSDSASSLIPTKKKKMNSVKVLLQEKRIQLPELQPSCSKDTQFSSTVEAPVTEINVNSINDTIESVINAACTKHPNSTSISGENDVNPQILMEIIESLKTEAKLVTSKNTRLFSDQMNMLLLSLEYQKEIFSFNANSIYEMLAVFMVCDKEKLVKQVNKLVDAEEAKISDLIIRLKTSIENSMPAVIEQYNIDCKTVMERRNVNGNLVEGMKSKPGPKLPRRKFPWTDEFRGYLREIINIRTTTYSKIKRIDSVDSYITKFLNNRIKPLWPLGWMKVTILLKESKVKDSRPKLTKKQALHNSPSKLLSAIKIASEHKVSKSAMSNKTHKWTKQKINKVGDSNVESNSVITSQTKMVPHSMSTKSKPLQESSNSVAISSINNDLCPYQATITTASLNGDKSKESDCSSVIVKTKPQTGEVLDLSPNKVSSLPFTLNKFKDVSVINNNLSHDSSSPGKTDTQNSQKQLSSNVINQPISRKQRLLQELNSPLLTDQQRVSHNNSPIELHSTIKKENKTSSLSKAENSQIDDKPTAKDLLSQIINDSLMDNTTPLQSQLTTFFKPKESPTAPITIKNQELKVEYKEQSHSDQCPTKATFNNNRASSIELAEKEAQEVIKDLLVLNQLSSSSSCSSRNSKEKDAYKKQTSSMSMYSIKNPFDTVVNTSLGVINHPAFRNSYNTSSSGMSKSYDSSKLTSIGIPKMSFGFQDEFFKHMVKTEEPNSLLASENYQKQEVDHYGILPNSSRTPDKHLHQQFYSSLNTKPKTDLSHSSISYSNSNN
ncbi:ubinuclein-2-like [Daktulosphaira vitifoliae]|uniref:ubinuclein-2-like n=1 Tax=Daktulosphaira vitifoliae TaxID=58002 RepID=UPI0021AAAB70|nr:ubinuclein-2-like [Daktulosphaira vitifoliae]